MISDFDSEALSFFAQRIRQRYLDARIWAFGSRVRGHASWESDLDVCVIVEVLSGGVWDYVIEIAWEVGFQRGIVISPICFSRDQFEKGPLSESSIVKTIIREGIAA